MTRRGRRRLEDDRASTSIYLRCTPAQRVELQRVAAENHCRLSTVVRDAIADYCDRGASGSDTARPSAAAVRR